MADAKIRLALYQPDIPQNTGAAMRLCACLGAGLAIIEPCGFVWDDKKVRRSGMDYIDAADIVRHASWAQFLDIHQGKRRIILLTTKGAAVYTDFVFRPDDILLAGRESAGVPDEVHEAADARIVIPMRNGMRSLNVVNAAAMALGEALRQVKG
jgi:tRNA (cytidine/uridine-2'-O-)-methyltransferase